MEIDVASIGTLYLREVTELHLFLSNSIASSGVLQVSRLQELDEPPEEPLQQTQLIGVSLQLSVCIVI
jgi:hypothetical protein